MFFLFFFYSQHVADGEGADLRSNGLEPDARSNAVTLYMCLLGLLSSPTDRIYFRKFFYNLQQTSREAAVEQKCRMFARRSQIGLCSPSCRAHIIRLLTE